MPRVLRDHGHALRQPVVLHLIVALVLLERDIDHIIARADQIFLDLLVCPDDGGNDRDDRSNTDDDAEHRQERAELMAPDSLKGQGYIL